MNPNDVIILVHCHMVGNYFSAAVANHEHVYGTTNEHEQFPAGGDTSAGVTVKSDADASKGSEGSVMIRAWDPRTSYMFELKYVCNDQLNNSVVVTPHDGFEVTINPTPEVIKTAKSLFVNIVIKQT